MRGKKRLQRARASKSLLEKQEVEREDKEPEPDNRDVRDAERSRAR